MAAYLDAPVAVAMSGTSAEGVTDDWKTHAVTLADPDGFRVVLVPQSGPFCSTSRIPTS